MKIVQFSTIQDFIKVFRQNKNQQGGEDVLIHKDALIPTIGYGTWVPTASNVTNDATVTLSSGIYSRIGSIVNFSLNCTVEMAVDQPSTSFTFSLPIASAFTDAGELKAAISGTLQDTSFDPPSPLYRVNISAGTGVASVSAFNGKDDGAVYAVNIVGQYIVV